MTKPLFEAPEEPGIIVEPLHKAIGERYLQYALSTIMNRALPDARDGLKPVHRRILYAMRELKLSATSGFRKSAKISGDVMGNYHPHGNQAIYDALARLAQDFNMRYPLVNGQGNFGSVDGDNPAADRYTEARLTEAAEALMDGLSENAVDFRDNYDGTLQEPVVLPATFPNLLANGASGIAVGMATNIPPHNIGELCDAALHLIKAPNARIETLMEKIHGPDFPTGGVLVESRESMLESYKTGRGFFRLRAKWDVERLSRGQWQIVVDEIPYQVQKSKLIAKVADLIQAKKLPALVDIRDESAEDIRVILEPRSKNIDPAALMETMFKNSDLEIRFSLNMNALIDGRVPKLCSLKEALKAFIDHRREVLVRRSRHRLEKIDHRLEVLEGYLVAFKNLDRVIEIIRNEDDPKAVMMKEFELTDTQAEAILNLRLRSLRKLEELELRKEHESLLIEREELDKLLESEKLQWSKVAEQIKEARKKFGQDTESGARRTKIEDPPQIEEVSMEAIIEREPVTVICSKMGWIRAMRGHIDLGAELKFKDGDGDQFRMHAETTDRLMLFASNGRMYTVPCALLPGGRSMGEPIRLMVDMPNDADMVSMFVYKEDARLLVASTAGDGFIAMEKEAVAQTKSGKQVMNLKNGAKARVCRRVEGDHVACLSSSRKLLVIPLGELPEMERGKGVRMQKCNIDKGEILSDAKTFTLKDGLSWKDGGGRTRTETSIVNWMGKRAAAGKAPPQGFPRDGRFT